MTTRTADALAGIIRAVDGDNTLSAGDLGWEIATRVCPSRLDLYGTDFVKFVERTNPDKAMGAGQLAELIVAEFDLDKE